MSSPPSIDALLAEWWGGGTVDPLFCFSPSLASNIRFGGNPPYQISDFFAVYPKFGNWVEGLQSVVPGSPAGTGYAVSDVLTVLAGDGTGKVTIVAVSAGVPTGYAVSIAGRDYEVANGIATSGGVGTGALVNVVSLTPYDALIPQSVMQMFVTLASACLQKAKWLDTWSYAMALFIAHYVTLYLDSQGNVSSAAGVAAVTGLGKGIAVSKAAGDVSVSYQPVIENSEGWGAWNLTSYGQQLITLAKVIGIGPMWIYG